MRRAGISYVIQVLRNDLQSCLALLSQHDKAV